MVGNGKLHDVKVEPNSHHHLHIDTSRQQDQSLSLLSPQSTSSSHSSNSTQNYSYSDCSSKAAIKYEESESTLGCDKLDRNGREARNRAEKNRRDKLNGSIQELSTMVPHVAESPRRVDKTAVLRFSAHGLRLNYVFGNKAKPARILGEPKKPEGLIERLLDSFLLSVTCRGNIVLVSGSIEKYLGHCRSDLYGQSLLNITHPDDHALLKQQLIPTDLHNLFASKMDESGEIRSRTQDEEDEIDGKLRDDRRDFTIRLARAGPRSEPTVYEVVKIDGCFKRADHAPRGRTTTGPTGLQLIRRARGRDDSIPLHSISGNDVVLIAMARVIKPPVICDRLIEACRYEYKTRNLIDGRIVQCDQRISIVAGYLTDEVSGLSPFNFIHRDDVRWVMVALRQMYDFGKPYGESCYRLMSRTGQFIYLRTRGFLDVDEETRQVRSFVCVNTLMTEDEGRLLIKEMKRKFSAIISEAELSALESDIPAVENPNNLEHAIRSLITNLNSQSMCDDDDDEHSMSDSSSITNGIETVDRKLPLAIIAPEADTIKTSITRAADVISHAIQMTGKSPRIKDEPLSPDPVIDSPAASTSSLSSNDPLSPCSSASSTASSNTTTTSIPPTATKAPTGSNDHQQRRPLHESSVAPATISVITSTGDSTASSNRSSVLKRTHSRDDSDYTETSSKKRVVADVSNYTDNSLEYPANVESEQNLDLLETADTADLNFPDVLSASFPDESLAENFNYGISSVPVSNDGTTNIDNDDEEQREILNSLRETCSVIQATPKGSSDLFDDTS